jgi:hypothetical protein
MNRVRTRLTQRSPMFFPDALGARLHVQAATERMVTCARRFTLREEPAVLRRKGSARLTGRMRAWKTILVH